MKNAILTTAALLVSIAAPAFADDGLACASANHVRIGDACVLGTEAVKTWTVFGIVEPLTANQIAAMSGTVFVQGVPVMCADFPGTVLHLSSPAPSICMGEIAHAGPVVEVNAPSGERWYRYDEVDPTTGALSPQLIRVTMPAQVPAGFDSMAKF